MLTRIRNALAKEEAMVTMPSSKLKVAVAKILHEEGYILRYAEEGETMKTLNVTLKYFEGRPAIETLRRFSRPSVRRYRSTRQLPKVIGGLGIAIISTSKGVMTDKAARAQKIGGEVLCIVA